NFPTNTLSCTLPWLPWEREQLNEIFGPDWWPYGIEANRHVLEHLIRYMGEQGLLARMLKVEEVFAPNVVGEFKIWRWRIEDRGSTIGFLFPSSILNLLSSASYPQFFIFDPRTFYILHEDIQENHPIHSCRSRRASRDRRRRRSAVGHSDLLRV